LTLTALTLNVNKILIPQSQEECTSLAVQLAEGQRLEGDLKDNLEQAHGEINRLQKVG
jgi:hypothetical protein